MGWVDESGNHEGWAAAITKDGRVAGSYSSGYVTVKGITGNYPADDLMTDYERVPDADVTGWRAQCECGWTGQQFIPRPADEDSWAPEDVEDALHQEWKAHSSVTDATTAVQDAMRKQRLAMAALDRAVIKARLAGVTWNDIGLAAGMSRQAAHERWG